MFIFAENQTDNDWYHLIFPVVKSETGEYLCDINFPEFCPVCLNNSEFKFKFSNTYYPSGMPYAKQLKLSHRFDFEINCCKEHQKNINKFFVLLIANGCFHIFVKQKKYAEKLMKINDDANCYVISDKEFFKYLFPHRFAKAIKTFVVFGIIIPVIISFLV